MPVDIKVVGGFEVVTYSARIIVFGKILGTRQAKDMSTFSKDRF